MLAAVIGAASSTQAQQGLSTISVPRHANPQASSNVKSNVTIAQVSQGEVQKTAPQDQPPPTNTTDVVKVGTRLIPSDVTSADAILAKVQSHEWAGRQSATLYVRNIPVLTFLGGRVSKSETVKLGVTAPPASKEAQAQRSASAVATGNNKSLSATASSSEADDPVSLATTVAAQLNQLTLSPGKGNVTVHWVAASKATATQSGQYEIRIDGKPLVALNQKVVLAGQAQQSEANALQATNRLRRLLGNATPLTTVANKPKQNQAGVQQVALGPVRFSLNGVASWYGPGFHGNLSANGEIYNQYALTAAHKTLPFGTKIKVTNLNNGRSVVVRVNDRGPYVGDRIIDLSLGAAEVIGMMGSGVAPVQLDILN